jgi:hypothetical protein
MCTGMNWCYRAPEICWVNKQCTSLPPPSFTRPRQRIDVSGSREELEAKPLRLQIRDWNKLDKLRVILPAVWYSTMSCRCAPPFPALSHSTVLCEHASGCTRFAHLTFMCCIELSRPKSALTRTRTLTHKHAHRARTHTISRRTSA